MSPAAGSYYDSKEANGLNAGNGGVGATVLALLAKPKALDLKQTLGTAKGMLKPGHKVSGGRLLTSQSTCAHLCCR